MLSDEVIGVAGVFLFTFSMIGLYHLICQLGPIAKRPTDRQQLDHPHEPAGDWQRNAWKPRDGDTWWLWNPTPDNHPDGLTAGFGENRQQNDSLTRDALTGVTKKRKETVL